MEVIPAGMNLPNELEFRRSDQDPSKIGVWTKKQVNRGRLYGPFKGEKKRCNDVYNDTYSWQIIGRKGRRLFCIDASDASKGNWMRFVKTAPNSELHNLCPVQHKKKIYYKVLRTITSSTELLCWYEGAADPDNDTKDSDVLPMPVLEKMDAVEDVPFKPFQEIPSPLQVLPDNVPDALEPPLISPMFPVPSQGEPPLESNEIDKLSSAVAPDVNVNSPHAQTVTPAIQAPDVTSTGGVDENLKQSLPSSMGGRDDSDIVTSSQINARDRLVEDKLQKKTKTQKLMGNKERKKLVSKYRKKFLKDSGQTKGPWKVRKNKEFHEMIMEPYVIGPESVVVHSDGSERYMCQKCGKLCKYPVGLKIHLRTNHHFYNVYIKGIAKKPWARGIQKERERNSNDMEPLDEHKDVTWKSVDCSLVQTALEKLKDGGDEGKFIKEEKEVLESEPAVSDSGVLTDNATTNNVSCKVSSGDIQPVTGSESEMTIPQPQTEIEGQQGILLNTSDKGSEGEVKDVLGSTTQGASNLENSKDKTDQLKKKASPHIFPKKYSCHVCHQAFAYKFWRDRHLQKHLQGDSGHICQLCNLRFFSKKNLISHQKTHRGEGGGNVEVKRASESKESFTYPAIIPHEPDGVERMDIINNNDRLSWPQDEHSGMVDYKGKGKKHLKQSKKIKKDPKSKSSSGSDAKGKQAGKSNRRGSGDRKYLCRLCGSAFSNPSNRSRHLRAQHGVAARKKVVESRLKEKTMDFVFVEGRIPVTNDRPTPPTLNETQKRAAYSAKKPTIHESRRISANYFGKRNPRGKLKVNKIVAHQRSRSKRKSTFMIEFLDYEEFPRGPGITCPWDRVNMPGPYVPQKKTFPIDMTCVKSERASYSDSGSCHRMQWGVLDSFVSWNGSSSDRGIDQMGSHSMLAKSEQISSADPDQPLDLSCKATLKPVGKKFLEKFGAYHDVQPAYVQSKCSVSTKGRGLLKVFKQERRRCFKGKKISSKISQKQTAASLNPVRWHFVCNICDGSFASIRELSQHVIAHAEDYPYKCEFCMNVFTSCDALREHKQTKHSVKKMYTCSVCKQEFAYLSNLKKHQNAEHPGKECTFDENFSNDVRPQNFTDPTKAFNLRVGPAFTCERVSFLKEEMEKLTPLKNRVISPGKKSMNASSCSPKKQVQEKGMLFNPQRNHPFEKRRKIGYLSMLSDPRNQKQLGSKVNNVCTKCLKEFKDTSEFHVHIMECANIKDDPSTELKEVSENSNSSNQVNLPEGTLVDTKIKKGVKNSPSPKKVMLGSKKHSLERAKPGTIMYDPQKYIRAKSASTLEDIHACAGCGKKFYFINKLERHMKLCPNRDKIVSAHKSNVALALRKRPRLNTVQHKCTNCEKHFTYLGSLEKHLLLCTRRDLVSSHPGESRPNGDTAVTGTGDSSTPLKPSLPTLEQESPTVRIKNFGDSPPIRTGKRKRRCKSFESFWQVGKR